jgi:hypothetical protein
LEAAQRSPTWIPAALIENSRMVRSCAEPRFLITEIALDLAFDFVVAQQDHGVGQ